MKLKNKAVIKRVYSLNKKKVQETHDKTWSRYVCSKYNLTTDHTRTTINILIYTLHCISKWYVIKALGENSLYISKLASKSNSVVGIMLSMFSYGSEI